jgi:Bifunctional DNA primase/polymerase, N-terminal/Family of unknown function (DUF5906)/Primase C terminal 2 (PriCT-2)
VTDKTLLESALDYASIGWYVFPLASTGDTKMPHPMLGRAEKGGPPRGHTLASVDPDKIRAWWKRDPRAGIGLWVSKSKMIVIDVDPRHGGNETLAALESSHGGLSASVVGLTGGGGQHKFYAAPEGLLSPPGYLGRKVKSSDNTGIDVKYNGYVVLPPSIHPDTKKRYRWQAGFDPFDDVVGLSAIPDWCLVRQNGHVAGRGMSGAAGDDPFIEDTQTCGLTIDQVRENLFLVPNSDDDELDYETWVNVLMGVYHETGGSAEGEVLALEWSQQAVKHNDADFNKKWPSLDQEGKGRQPITFRFVLKLAKENRAERDRRVKASFITDIEGAVDLATLKSLFPKIKRSEIDGLTRTDIAKRIVKRYTILEGVAPLLADIKRQIRYETTEDTETPPWLKGWVFCEHDGTFFRRGTRTAIKTSAFNLSHNRYLLSDQDRREGIAVPQFQAADVALNLQRIKSVFGRMYYPGQPSFFEFGGSRWVNFFSARSQPEVPDKLYAADREAIACVERHFRHLISDNRERMLAESWFAHVVQTQQRPNWAVVLQGPEGEGKSFFLRLMQAVLGGENVNTVAANTIQDSTFNSWAEGCLLNVIDEVKQSGRNRHVIMNRLQTLITNDVIEIHRKNASPFPAKNTAAYLLLTNHRDALPLMGGDSRYFVLASPRQTIEEVDEFKAANPTYYNDLFGSLEFAGAIRKWFLDYELHPEFNAMRRAPHSREREHAVSINKNNFQESFEEIISEGRVIDLSSLLIDATKLADALSEDEGEAPMTRALHKILLDGGFTHLGRFKVDGKLSRYWTRKPSVFKGSAAETAAKIREILDPEI